MAASKTSTQSETAALFLPMSRLLFFTLPRNRATVLASDIVTDTAARAHFVGLRLALLENGVSNWIQRSWCCVTLQASWT